MKIMIVLRDYFSKKITSACIIFKDDIFFQKNHPIFFAIAEILLSYKTAQFLHMQTMRKGFDVGNELFTIFDALN